MSQPDLSTDKQKNSKKIILVGAHLSITGGFHKLSERMEEIGATCCAFFLKNQRRFVGKPMDTKDVELFKSQYYNEENAEYESIPTKRTRVNEEIKIHNISVDEDKSNQISTKENDQKQKDNSDKSEKEIQKKSDQSEQKRTEPNQDTVEREEEKQNKTCSNKNSQSIFSTEKKKNINILVPHASYLINMANATEKRESHLSCFFDELERCKLLGIRYLNIHPGSDTSKLGIDKASQLIADAVNEGHKKNKIITILLENMAGQGTVLCSKFEEIRKIIDKVEDKTRIGVCIDTAHLFGAGHDIRTKEKYENVIKQIDQIIGLKYIKAMHLNDSHVELNSKRDRHAQIGCGHIGKDAFKFIMRDKRFVHIPKILETPDETKYAQEIALLKKFAEEEE